MKIDTNTILLVGAGGIAVYLLTRQSSVVNPYGSATYNPYQLTAAQQIQVQQQQQGNSTSGIISSIGTGLGSILTAISNF